MLTSPFQNAETFVALKTFSQLRNKEDTNEFNLEEGMVIAVECNEFKIKKIDRE